MDLGDGGLGLQTPARRRRTNRAIQALALSSDRMMGHRRTCGNTQRTWDLRDLGDEGLQAGTPRGGGGVGGGDRASGGSGSGGAAGLTGALRASSASLAGAHRVPCEGGVQRCGGGTRHDDGLRRRVEDRVAREGAS